MLTTREVRSVLVCHRPRKGKEYASDGLPRRGRKIGKVFKTVFDPSGMRVVGFIVKRPDLLWMFKRPDRFLALDAMDASEGVIRATRGADSWDERAIRRCGLDWDSCILWEGMRTRTTEGEELGRVDDISFDPQTGAVGAFFLDDGGTARALIGSVEIPADLVVGYKNDYLLVRPEAARCKLTGGLAAKAGTATAKASIAAREGTRKADEAAAKAVEAGAQGVGKGVRRLKDSFTGFAEGFRQEAPVPAKKGAETAGAAKAAATAKKPAGASTSASSARKPASAESARKASSNASSSASAAKKKAAASASGSVRDAGKAVSSHLKGATTMFSDFKREFDKARDE